MKEKAIYFIVIYLFLHPFLAFSQFGSSEVVLLREEKGKFLRNLKNIPLDSAIINSLARQFEAETGNIYYSISNDPKLPAAEKEKAIRSLAYFTRELGRNIEQQKIEVYDIPGALQSYKSILRALVSHRPVSPLLVQVGPRRSQLLSSAFSQYKEYQLLDDVAVYKRVASSPEFILQFLESKPGFRFADSLLLDAAAHDPLKLVFYINNDKPGIQNKIRNTRNIYLRQIELLAAEKNASELLPFVVQIAENRITPEQILQTRTNVIKYYQLLVNTLQETKNMKDSSFIFLKPLRKAIKQKSLAFFVNSINDLHSSPDAVRFASVKGLRPEDLYYIITSCGEELYTSSYLGLYKRLMEHFKGQNADSLFQMVKYDNYRTFIRLAANYNVLVDFLRNMPQPEMQVLLRRFIAGIEKDTDTGLENAMDIADCFGGFDVAPEIGDLVQSELQYNLRRCTSGQQYLGMRLYSILLQVYGLVKQDGNLSKLWTKLGNYEVLKRSDLANKNGEIVQLTLFYGDEDGVSSFNNFLRLYSDKKKWEVTKNKDWVAIRSLSDQPLMIYANLPLDSEEELDLKAQDNLAAYLQQQSLEPTVLIHRGHSYHLDKTLKRLQPSVKLAILGSCGGYNKAISIASINPDVQVIGSKKTGAKSINDPILYEINETLLRKEDLSWSEIWKKLTARFSKDEATLNLFNEYFSPNKNVSLFVLKLFMYSDRHLYAKELFARGDN
jgi:hypothetical protein